jgi:GT2 family glycosyltransferase
MDLSIIITSFNTREILRNCLISVRKSAFNAGCNYEIIVVDNASTDGSAGMVEKDFSEVGLIKNNENMGFAKANNLGIKKATGKYVLLLNSDTVIFSDVIPKMIHFMIIHPETGVATCRVELENGSLDPACHRGFPTPWASFCYFSKLERLLPKWNLTSGYHQWYKDFSKPHEIDSCSGAFYFIRKQAIEEAGLLDEDYFMYGEDLDWSYRIKQKGWKIMYNPETKIIHYKKQSGLGKKDAIHKITKQHFYDAMEMFYRKHYEKKYPSLINKVVLWSIRIIKNIN